MADYSTYGGDTNGDPYLDWIRSLQKRDAEQMQADQQPQQQGGIAGIIGKLAGGGKDEPKRTTTTEYPIGQVGATIPPPPPPPPPPDKKIGMFGGPTTAEEIAQNPHAPGEIDPSLIEIDPTPQDPYAADAVGAQPVDAVSGAAPAATPSDVLAHEATITTEQPSAAPQTPDAYLASMQQQVGAEPLPSTRDRLDLEAKQNAVASMTPEQFAQYQVDFQRKQELEQARLQHEAAAKSERDAFTNLQMQRAAFEKASADTQDLIARADELSKQQIDPDRYLSQRGIGGAFRDVFSSFLLGLSGRPDLAINTIQSRINRDVEAQTQDLQTRQYALGVRRNAIADELARHQDLYRAQETYRVASYQSAINDIQTQLQQYDPNGATAIAGRNALGQLQAMQMKTVQDFQKNQTEIGLKRVEMVSKLAEMQKTQAETAKIGLESKKLQGALGGGGGGQKYKPEYFSALGLPPPPWAMTEKEHQQWMTKLKLGKGLTGGEDAMHPPEFYAQQFGKAPPSAMSMKDFKTWAETGKATEEYSKSQRENAMQEQATVLRNPVTQEVLKTKDGQPVRTGSAEMADKENEKIGTAQTFVDVLSKSRRMLESDPSSVDRSTWQTIKTDLEQAKVAYIQAHGAKPSSREMQAVEEMFGPNFESFTSRLSGKGKSKASIDALIEGAQRELDNELGTKYGAKVKLLDTSKPTAAAPTPIDRSVSVLATDLTKKQFDSMSAEDRGYLASLSPRTIPQGEELARDAQYSPEVQRAVQVRVAPSKLRIFDELAADASGADAKKRDEALAVLNEQAQRGLNQYIRSYAQKVLQDVASTGMASAGTTEEPEPEVH